MLISIPKIYSKTEVYEILINTNYILRIVPYRGDYEPLQKAKSIIYMPGVSRDKPEVIFTEYSISTIKGFLTKARNKNNEEEN